MPPECFGTCCVRAAVCPLTCQFAVELLQEAGLSGVEGQKNKADWVGTRLMSGLCLWWGEKKKKKRGSICMKKGVAGACTYRQPWLRDTTQVDAGVPTTQ